MTLHETVENFKKFGVGSAIGLTAIITLVITIRVGILIKDILFPIKADPANHTYGKLTSLTFPDNATSENLTYSLDTESGSFDSFPDRLNVYRIDNPEANFLNLEKAKDKAKALFFLNDAGEVIPEIPLGNANYEWDEARDLQRKLIMNIVSFDFNMTSNYLTSLTVLKADGLPDTEGAIRIVSDFLGSIKQLHDTELDFAKTSSNSDKLPYYTTPQVLAISNGQLIPATSYSSAHIVRVDLYQKDVEYELDTGFKSENITLTRKKVKYPILYPRPPFSTMSLWVGVGPNGPTVVNAKYAYKGYIVTPLEQPTYSLKTPDAAFEELKNGKGYIAAFNAAPGDTEVHIKKAYIAYYIGENPQSYLMPIFVFEGDKGFFGYVSAVVNEWVE